MTSRVLTPLPVTGCSGYQCWRGPGWLTPGITGRLLYLAGADDSLIDADQRRQIRDALTAAGTDHELVVYPGAGHAFFWPGTPPFNQAARDDAWARILALLAS